MPRSSSRFGVIETVSDTALRSSLNRFGPLKDLDIVRSKACAFAEFTTIDGAKKAIVASLPHNMGGDGGIRIDVGEGNFVKINVETKKERGERPVSNRGRGGAMQNGDRGGYYGGEGRRGGFGPRGGPRGRGIGGGK
ncbi:hypothetical protein ONZ45_g17901 [Pleurotus djamor]|nr:hypothetical protein ONZ45_g17901 [Pleurotus djamor]